MRVRGAKPLSFFSKRCTTLLLSLLSKQRTTRLLGISVLTFLFTTLSIVALGGSRQDALNLLSYSTRPLWDKPAKPWTVIPRYHSPSRNASDLCGLHGWPRATDPPPRIIDAILFSVELDLLEIRLRELLEVVDLFVIVESDGTFTGFDKPYVFAQNRERFSFAEDKIVYRAVKGLRGEDGNPFAVENKQRRDMTEVLEGEEVRATVGDIVIMADVDEIPSASAISLLKGCRFEPDIIHLRMRNHVYSFDLVVDDDHWRAKAVRITPPPMRGMRSWEYSHSRKSDVILSSAGWHCSWCFKRVSDYVFKMTAYSHADRVTHKGLLDPKRIRKVVCDGTDVFGMLAEAYSFRDLVWKSGPARRLDSVVDAPKYLVEAALNGRFAYLLPGGCHKLED